MFVRIADLDVHVLNSGPAGPPPLILLHSLGTDANLWEPTAAALAGNFRVIRPDLRGHGLTACTPGPYTLTQMADDLAGLLDHFNIHIAHIGGVSLGGMVAQAFAAQYPGRTASLILADTAMALPPASTWRDRAAAVRKSGLAPVEDGIIERWVTPDFAAAPQTAGLRAVLRRTPCEGYAAAAEAIAAADLTVPTSWLRIPTLILVGAHDQTTPLAAAQALQKAIAGAELRIIPNAAHLALVEQSEAVTAEISAFLQPAVTDYLLSGTQISREVLGAPQTAATAFDQDFQGFVARTEWGAVWSRPGLDRRTRALLTIAILAALGQQEALATYCQASANSGATPADVAETLLHLAPYAGIPAANTALRTAKSVLPPS